MTLLSIFTAERHRTAYRYVTVGIVLMVLVAMRFVDDLPADTGRYVINGSALLVGLMMLIPPPGGFVTVFFKDEGLS